MISFTFNLKFGQGGRELYSFQEIHLNKQFASVQCYRVLHIVENMKI